MEDQHNWPLLVSDKRFGQSAGPAGVASEGLPGVGDAGGVIALGWGLTGGDESGLALPRLLHETRLAQQPGGAAGRALGRVEHDMVSVLVGSRRVVQPRETDA